jgi:hypothetical protein
MTAEDRETLHQKVKALAANPGSLSEQDIRFLEKNDSFLESIPALSKSKDPAARAALFRLATSKKVEPIWALGAAGAIANTMQDKLEALPLLKTDNTAILERVMPRMIGCALTPRSWAEIQPLLAFPSARVRGLVALIVKEDKGNVPPGEQAKSLVVGMEGLETLPGATKLLGYGFDGAQFAEYEIVYEHFFSALAALGRFDPSILRGLTPTHEGNSRDCLLLARAECNDAEVRSEVRRIVVQQPSAIFRRIALRLIERAGTPEDLPSLEKVAHDDPLLLRNYVPHLVRSAADMEPRNCYLLREQAQNVIELIQAREKLSITPK